MCIKCTYLQEDPPRWTCMSYGSYNKTGGLTSECDPKCKKWQSVQKHKFCFHASHATPPPWDQCGQIRWHKEDLLLILHPQQSVPLPNPLVVDAFSRKARVDSRLEKPFFADKVYRNVRRGRTCGACGGGGGGVRRGRGWAAKTCCGGRAAEESGGSVLRRRAAELAAGVSSVGMLLLHTSTVTMRMCRKDVFTYKCALIMRA